MVTRGGRSMASVAAQSEDREDRGCGLAVGNSVRPTLYSDQCPAARSGRPLPRDLPVLLQKDQDRLETFFSGSWGWFALLVSVSFLAPWVEELFFRGLLLPRMRKVCGRIDWVVNGAMFGLYHLHQPWSMPASILDGALAQAFPTKWYQSTWMGLITHTIPSFVIITVVLSLVL
jgi:uncharacterized protein